MLATDYSHQNLGDMEDDLKDWINFIDETVNEIKNNINTLHENKYWRNVDQDFIILIKYSLKFYQTCRDEIISILNEIQSEIRRDHYKRLRHIGDKAIELNHDFGKIWHREYRNKDYGNDNFKLVESIYAKGRDIAVDLQDIQSLAIRLKDYIGKKGNIALDADFSLDNNETVLNSLWVIESEKADESNINQGTGFSLESIGLITCSHVLSDKVTVYTSYDINKKYNAKILYDNPVIDLAVLEIEGNIEDSLHVGNSDEIKLFDSILLVGFPNYNLGDTGIFKYGKICGSRMKSAVKRFLIDTSIIAGNSGGPVMNQNLEVIGVAVTGADRMEDADRTEEHGVIPINALELMGIEINRKI